MLTPGSSAQQEPVFMVAWPVNSPQPVSIILSISAWFNQPYPGFTQPLKDSLWIVLVGVLMAALLLVARPFGLAFSPWLRVEAFILSASGAAIGIGLLNVVVLPLVWRSAFREASWTIKRQVLFETWYLITAAMGLLSVASGFGIARWSWTQAAIYTSMTVFSASFP